MRWALEDQKGLWRDRFWKFIDRSCTEPASETLFKECFGIDYGRGAALLRLYLVSAVLNPAVWRAEGPAELPPLLFRDATGSDLSRIKGDWERLAANYVRTNLPALETPYVEQARRTLRRSYDKGDRDPRLLAALGLAECDAGHASGARDFLEAAMRGGVVRPRAYLELARLRFAEQRAQLETPGEKLRVAPTTEVLAPLLIARRQAPPLQPVYELIAEAWMSSAVAPQRTDLAVLDEGVRFFPKSAELIHRTATLYFAQGFLPEAAQLVEAGLRVAPNEATRARFNALQAAIAAAK